MDRLRTFPIIITDRLELKKIESTDSNYVYNILSDEDVIKYDTFDLYKDINQAKSLIEFFHEQYDKNRAIFWGIFIKNTKVMIGFCKLEIEVPKVRADIGYDLAKKYWNKGFMTEALKAIIDFAFENIGVNRIEASVDIKNEASIKVLKKNGFLQEGVMRQRSYFHGVYHDMIMLSILKSDYTNV